MIGLILAAAMLFHGSSINQMTFYGWPDNSPPGASIAYPGLHKVAGGTGTYLDPITFASSTTEFPEGTRLYIPNLKKYVIMEDNCVDCSKDAKKGIVHIDVWINSNSKYSRQELTCEDRLTPDGRVAVVINPPKTEAVNTTPLFNIQTGKCSV